VTLLAALVGAGAVTLAGTPGFATVVFAVALLVTPDDPTASGYVSDAFIVPLAIAGLPGLAIGAAGAFLVRLAARSLGHSTWWMPAMGSLAMALILAVATLQTSLAAVPFYFVPGLAFASTAVRRKRAARSDEDSQIEPRNSSE
jgi:hypothetical protein